MNESLDMTAAAGFRRVLLVRDESGEGRAAARYAADLSDQFGGTVATLEVVETKARHRAGPGDSRARCGPGIWTCAVSGPTEGARSHTLAEEIGRTAEGFGADLVVLGLTRSRLARHRLAPSLRSLVAQSTEVPVLLAPTEWGAAETPAVAVPAPDRRWAERDVLVQGRRHAGV